jgi:hypothetical protein
MTTANPADFPHARLDPMSLLHSCAASIGRLTAARGGTSRRREPTVRRLEQYATLTIAAPSGYEIRCNSGTVWLTDTIGGDAVDAILKAGQTYRCASRAAALIYAIADAELRLA